MYKKVHRILNDKVAIHYLTSSDLMKARIIKTIILTEKEFRAADGMADVEVLKTSA
jgi:hypothetical protein